MTNSKSLGGWTPWRRLSRLNIVALSLVSLSAGVARAQSYSITDLGVLPGTQSNFAHAMNASGQVVGHTCLGSTGGRVYHAYRWTNGSIEDLGTLGGSESVAWDINDAGIAVGSALRASESARAVYWGPSGIVDILRKDGSFASGINNANPFQIALAVPGSGKTPRRLALWRNGVLTYITYPGDAGSGALGAGKCLNDYGQVIGQSGNDRRWLWTPSAPNGSTGTFTLASAMGFDTLAGVTESGQVFGVPLGQINTIGLWTPFVPNGTSGTMHILAGMTGAASMNSLGQAVGTMPWNRAAIWDAVNGARDLNTLIPPGTAWELREAIDINDAGQIVGYGHLNGFGHAFLLTPL